MILETSAALPTGLFTGQGWRQAGELGAALLLSVCIGVEREFRQKNAGLRTHTLVGLSAALFVLVSKYGFNDVIRTGMIVLDPSRIAAQIVSGIGFLGAGLIFVRKDAVRGLTTAASVWVTAAIGAAAGAGLVLLAAETTVIYLVIVEGVLRLLSHRMSRSYGSASALQIRYLDGRGVLRCLLQAVTDRGFTVDELSTESLGRRTRQDSGAEDARTAEPMVEVTLRVHGKDPVSELATALSEIDDVASVRVGDDRTVLE